MRLDKSSDDAVVACISALDRALPGRSSTAMAVRHQHSHSLTFIGPQPPDAVVWPETPGDVAKIVSVAAQYRVPLIAFGAGTSLEGQVNAPFGGVCVDFSRMNRIVAVRASDMDCDVEPGVTLGQLRAALRDTGLFFPVDPGSDLATLGGMTATRASGTTTVRYGSMRDNVLAATVVMADGTVIETARRARKSASGFDLTRLFVGSEGTLGLIAGLTLKLHGVPEKTAVAVAQFHDISSACQAAGLAVQSGLQVARLELMDAVQIACCLREQSLDLDELPTLFVEFHGTAATTLNDLDTFRCLAADCGSTRLRSALDERGRQQLWTARHNAFWAVKNSWPGKQTVVTDIAVPISRLAEAVCETADDIKANGLDAPIVGHVGDGNFHAIVAFDPDDPADLEKVEAFLDRLVTRALRLGGTATGEHGIGQGKARFMHAEHGPALAVMKAIKASLDPHGLMNPGKLFPREAAAEK